MNKCNANALGISLAVVSGLGMLILSLVGLAGYGLAAVASMQEWHIFFSLSWIGIIGGIIEAGIAGYIGGYIIAAVYNKYA